MKSFKVGPQHGWLVVVALFAFVMAVAWPLAAHAAELGVKIKISAKNRSTTDTPFCGVGGGLIGDKLQVNVFTDLSGVTTGTATFKDATGLTTTLDIDQVFGWGDAIVLVDSSTNNAVAIWYGSAAAPAHVNVEIPRGCNNTKSTFTLGVDKVSVQIKF
jgi:hypothetical protein